MRRFTIAGVDKLWNVVVFVSGVSGGTSWGRRENGVHEFASRADAERYIETRQLREDPHIAGCMVFDAAETTATVRECLTSNAC